MTLEVIDVIAVDVLAYRSLPRAATGIVPTISSPRTITTSSTMLTTTQTWFGTCARRRRRWAACCNAQGRGSRAPRRIWRSAPRDARGSGHSRRARRRDRRSASSNRHRECRDPRRHGSPRSNRCERAVLEGGDAGGDLHAIVVDVGAGRCSVAPLSLPRFFRFGEPPVDTIVASSPASRTPFSASS